MNRIVFLNFPVNAITNDINKMITLKALQPSIIRAMYLPL